jgi:hypothetical protein
MAWKIGSKIRIQKDNSGFVTRIFENDLQRRQRVFTLSVVPVLKYIWICARIIITIVKPFSIFFFQLRIWDLGLVLNRKGQIKNLYSGPGRRYVLLKKLCGTPCVISILSVSCLCTFSNRPVQQQLELIDACSLAAPDRDKRYGPSLTNKITPWWVTLLQPARLAAVLGQPSSFRLSVFGS